MDASSTGGLGSGNEQLRYKTILETEKDILSIEGELKRIWREKLSLQEDEISGNKTIQKQLEKLLDKQADILRKRQLAEKQLATAAELYRTRTEATERAAANRYYEKYKRDLNRLDIEKEINEIVMSQVKDELDIQKKISQEHQTIIDKIIAFAGKMGGMLKQQSDIYKFLKGISGASKDTLLIWASLATLSLEALNHFKSYDSVFAKFRISMGMMRGDAERFRLIIRQSATELAHLNVGFEDIALASVALGNEFGGTLKITKDLIDTTAILKTQLGVSEDISAGFLRNISALNKSTAQAEQHMVYYANALSAAAGVQFKAVMADVAKMSGNALAIVSRMPGQLIKSAVAAKTLGTTLNRMAEASRHILNFTESVQEEMNASVLLGQGINLQLARELAYRRNIEGSTREIIKEAKRLNFEKMDVFQMEAFAAATGRSADEIFKMLQAERQLDEARNIDGLKDQVAEYERLKGLREGDFKNEARQRELMVRQLANQERILSLQNAFNQLILEATSQFFPLIDVGLKFAGAVLHFTRGLFGVALPFKMIEESLMKIAQLGKVFGASATFVRPLLRGVVLFKKIISGIMTMGGSITAIGAKIANLIGPVAKFAAPFFKLLGPIGWIITAFQAIGSIFKNISAWRSGEISGWKAFGNVLYDVFLKPFVDAWNWISGKYVGHSPSFLMEGIIKGVVAGAAKLYDWITSPWRNAFAWILDQIPFLGKTMGEKLRGGLTGSLSNLGIIDSKIVPKIESPAKVVVSTPVIPVSSNKTEEIPSITKTASDSQNTMLLKEIIQNLSVLNNNLVNGKVAVYIDGQLASAIMARNMSHTKTYGAVV